MDEDMKKIMESMPQAETNGNSLFLPLMSLFMSMNNNRPVELEKEVAYLRGRLDTLEKVVLGE